MDSFGTNLCMVKFTEGWKSGRGGSADILDSIINSAKFFNSGILPRLIAARGAGWNRTSWFGSALTSGMKGKASQGFC